jgi:diazepam-binding inhibitor (GABA receptor modulating acyl-CoA-binding protein)
MELLQQFEQAVTDSKALSQKPSNDILLQLYALYKQSTEGDNEAEPPSNMFDFVSKAKYEAWLEHKGQTKDEAMQQYVDLVNKLKKG